MNDQVFRLQAAQCFTHRGSADAQALGDLVLTDAAPRLHGAVGNFHLEAAIGPFAP